MIAHLNTGFAFTRVQPREPVRELYIDMGPQQHPNIELLVSSGAIEMPPKPSLWHALLDWLCRPCAWGEQ